MIGLQTERAVATVMEDSTEEKAVARARVDVVTDLVTSIPKLGYWIAGGSIGHLKTRKASRKRLVMIPTKACITNSSSAFYTWKMRFLTFFLRKINIHPFPPLLSEYGK
jgi:hypothetical protein